MALKDLPLSTGAHIIDANGTVMGSHGQPLRVKVEGNHGEDLDHVRKNYAHVFVAILAEGKFVWVEASEQDLNNLN